MAQINDVSDHGLETLKKSAIIPDDTYKTRYSLRTRPLDANGRTFSIDGDGKLETIDDRFNFSSTRVLAQVTGSSVAIGDYGNLDAFSRLRVSEPYSKFEYNFYYDERPFAFTSSTASGGTVTYDSNKKAVILSATTTTNSEAVYQSRQYVKYHPGKSNLVVFTGNFKGGATNVIKRYGQFDDNNGFFFELNGTTPYVVLRSKVSGSVVDTKIAQTDWNLDKFNGAGVSGHTIDFSKQNIFFFEYQWLGTGRVRFGFDIDGQLEYCHQILNANNLLVLYSQTANLPIRASIRNTVSTASTLEMTCGVVISEGGSSDYGRLYTISSGTTPRTLTTAGTRLPVISIRKKTSFLEASIIISSLSFLFSSSDDYFLEIVKNGTLTNASWTDQAGFCQRDVAATAITGGEIFYSTYARGGTQADLLNVVSESVNMFLGSLLDGTSEIVSIVATNLTNNATIYTAINYKEVL